MEHSDSEFQRVTLEEFDTLSQILVKLTKSIQNSNKVILIGVDLQSHRLWCTVCNSHAWSTVCNPSALANNVAQIWADSDMTCTNLAHIWTA